MSKTQSWKSTVQIQHITSGKAIARALRVLHLLDAALHTKVMECLFPHAEHTGILDEDELESLVQLLQNTLEPGNEHCIEDIRDNTNFRLSVFGASSQCKPFVSSVSVRGVPRPGLSEPGKRTPSEF